MSRRSVAYDMENMTGFPASSSTVRTILKTEDGYILMCYGQSKPTDGDAGYSGGCIFIHTDGAAASYVYINEGSVTSADFDPIGAL